MAKGKGGDEGAAFLQLGNPIIDPIIAQYYEDLAALTEQARTGAINEREYERRLLALVTAVLLAVYLLGGGDPNSPKGQAYLEPIRQLHKESAKKMAQDVFDGRYSANDKQTKEEADTKVGNRLVLWTAVLGMIWHKAKLQENRQRREVWKVGAAEHCATCLNLDGVVLTREEWDRLGIDPQSSRLQCGGYRCKCTRTPTDALSVGLENVRLVGAS